MTKDKDSNASVRSEIEALSREIFEQLSRLPEQEQDRFLFEIKAKLTDQYFQTVKDIKGNKKLSNDEKLRRLITPLVLFGDPFNRRDGTYPFISESIQVSRELDLEYLKADPSKYRVETERTFLNPEEPSIFCKCKFQENISRRRRLEAECRELLPQTLSSESLGYVSLKEIYGDWLRCLNQEKIKSTDLLDQILVVYTIKRALNGDDNAIQKLYDLYISAAEGMAVKVLKSIARKFNYTIQGEDIKDIKQDAGFWLRIIIGGFKPENIIQRLLEDKEGGPIKLPPWVKSFFIYYLSEYIPQRTKKILKEARMNEDLRLRLKNFVAKDEETKKEADELISFFENRKTVLGIESLTLFNLYSPIQDGTLWKGTPKRINRFNSYSFRPGIVKVGPRWNLTTWLFGHKMGFAYPPTGKLYQLLRDKYKPLIKEKSKSMSFDFSDDFDEDNGEILSSEDRAKALGVEGDSTKYQDKHINKMITKERIKKIEEQLQRELLDLGAPPQTLTRNIGIYFNWKRNDLTQSEIAKEYGLSTRQVKRICQQIKKLLPKVKYLSRED